MSNQQHMGENVVRTIAMAGKLPFLLVVQRETSN